MNTKMAFIFYHYIQIIQWHFLGSFMTTISDIPQFKVSIVGSVSVGKTSISYRLQQPVFSDDYKPTINAGFNTYRLVFEKKNIILQLWDTSGMEKYNSINQIYYRGSDAALIVYDQTDPSSAEKLEFWVDCVTEVVGANIVFVIIGNKDDLDNKIVNNDKIQRWAEENGYLFYLTSAKNGRGIDDMLMGLTRKLMERRNENVDENFNSLMIKSNFDLKQNGWKCC